MSLFGLFSLTIALLFEYTTIAQLLILEEEMNSNPEIESTSSSCVTVVRKSKQHGKEFGCGLGGVTTGSKEERYSSRPNSDISVSQMFTGDAEENESMNVEKHSRVDEDSSSTSESCGISNSNLQSSQTQTYSYSTFDFVSEGSSSDSESTKPEPDSKSGAINDISDNSSDDVDVNSKPWKQGADESESSMASGKKPKTKLTQPKLSFAHNKQEIRKKSKPYPLRSRLSDRDTITYRQGYPEQTDEPEQNDNLEFYKGNIASHPNGDFIDDIHHQWWGNYGLLERHHGYIQWLFPIREDGMNFHAQKLQPHEAEAIKTNVETSDRVLKSYRLMLDFYGMELVDEDSGKIARSTKWKERFHNLNNSHHNYLRITRILKSLGELGFEHMKKPFLEFILIEIFQNRQLGNALHSCRDYWIGTVKSDKDRERLYKTFDDEI